MRELESKVFPIGSVLNACSQASSTVWGAMEPLRAIDLADRALVQAFEDY